MMDPDAGSETGTRLGMSVRICPLVGSLTDTVVDTGAYYGTIVVLRYYVEPRSSTVQMMTACPSEQLMT